MSNMAGCQQHLNPRNKPMAWIYWHLCSKPVWKPTSTRTAVRQNICILQSVLTLLHPFLHRKQSFTRPKKQSYKLHPQSLGKGDADEWNWGKCLYLYRCWQNTDIQFLFWLVWAGSA